MARRPMAADGGIKFKKGKVKTKDDPEIRFKEGNTVLTTDASSKNRIRTEFPETWLWSDFMTE